MKEARLYEKLSDDRVRCHLCAHRCTIPEGKKGICRVRENRGGTLYTLVYGRTIARHVDPVEKKPLFHFYPGTTAYSIATPGCNFRCRWCQNWEISQMPREQDLITGEEASPEQIVVVTQRAGCRSIAYTYTEPTVFFEYAYDTARLAHEAGLANICVTNGYMTEETLETFHPYLDAANVDLKAFRDETYKKYVGARLQPVLDSLKVMKRLGIWLEVTTLVIPGINDDPAELRDAASFVAQELGVETPWHISRFFPAYEMTDVPPTPVSTLQRAREIGLEAGLKYIYVGNVPDDGGQDTICPGCGRVLIRRDGFVTTNRVRNGRCPDCGASIAGIGVGGGWMDQLPFGSAPRYSVAGWRGFGREFTKAKTQDLDEEADMYNTILVPLDGSKRAEAILPHVEELAQRYDAKVIFLQVVEPIPLIVGPEGAHMALHQQELEQRTREAETYLAGLQGEFREKGIRARARIVYGPVVEAILHAAEREGADLIAIASHGRSGLSQVFYGSVAAGVLHRVDRPLLLVRSRGDE